MEKLSLFIPISKIDVAQRLVYGVMTEEVPDSSGEIMDYATGKPEFEKWSADAEARSDGKSKGNVRAMHSSIAAGKLTDIRFDDVKKSIEGVAKIVDDAEWEKVLEGVYTGFSIGGSYMKRWPDPNNPKLMRYTPLPSEVSIVDNPCCPTATFQMIKADGSVTDIKFKHKEITPVNKDELRKAAGAKIEQGWLTDDHTFYPKREEALEHMVKKELAAIEKKEFSDKKRKELADKGHALPDGSFPIETDADLKNAIRAIGRAKDPEQAKAHIITRAKELKATDLLPADWEGSTKDKDAEKIEKTDAVRKGMDDVARTACIIEHLNWLCSSVTMEEKIEGDEDSDSPAHLEEIIKELCEYLTNRVAEETKEIIDNQDLEEMVMELAAGLPKNRADAVAKLLSKDDKFKPLAAALAKAGARHSKSDMAHGEEVTKALGEMGDHIEDAKKCMGKMHKASGQMDSSHEEMMDCHKIAMSHAKTAKSEHPELHKAVSEMGDHLSDMKAHMGKVEKCQDHMEGIHKDMEECHKSATEHNKAIGFSKEPTGEGEDDVAEKARISAALRKAAGDSSVKIEFDADALKKLAEDFEEKLKKFQAESAANVKAISDKSEAEKAEITKKHEAVISDLEKRLKIIEGQPLPAKGAVFAVRKGHEGGDPEKLPVEAKRETIPISGRSPEEHRKLLGIK